MNARLGEATVTCEKVDSPQERIWVRGPQSMDMGHPWLKRKH